MSLFILIKNKFYGFMKGWYREEIRNSHSLEDTIFQTKGIVPFVPWHKILEDLKKYGFLFASMWMAHLSMGSTIAVIGPTLPYLGLNVGQSLSVVSFLYTSRSVGFVIVSIGTGIIFRRLNEGWKKMVWISGGLLIMGISIIVVPFTNNAIIMFAALFVYGAGSAMVDTADNSLVIYLLGPTKSRPLTQSLHFTLAIGAFLLPFIVRPFLIELGESNSTRSVCPTNSINRTEETVRPPADISDLATSPLIWPYIIVCCMCVVASCMYLCIAFRRPQLDEHSPSDTNTDGSVEVSKVRVSPIEEYKDNKSVVFKVVLIGLFMLFYFLHCGTENVFWSHLYAFGVCSDLKMSAGDASLLNLAFFGGFLAGRGSGVFVSNIVRPILIIIVGTTSCSLTTAALAIWGQSHATVTMVTSVIYGYSIAMIFGAGISWLAQHIDVTGAISSSWFIGAYLGISVLPALAGMFFDTSVGAIGVMYMICGTSAAVIVVFGVMNIFLKVYDHSESDSDHKEETEMKTIQQVTE